MHARAYMYALNMGAICILKKHFMHASNPDKSTQRPNVARSPKGRTQNTKKRKKKGAEMGIIPQR
jgi:hypothetical protein